MRGQWVSAGARRHQSELVPWERGIIYDPIRDPIRERNGSLRTRQVHPPRMRLPYHVRGSGSARICGESHGILQRMESATDTASPPYQRTFDWSIVQVLSFSSRDGDGRHCYDVCGQRNT